MSTDLPLEDLLKKAWNEAYRLRFGVDFLSVDVLADNRALGTLQQQAERRGWGLHEAIAFFRVAIEVLENDDYWKDNICLLGASKRINAVYAKAIREREAEYTRGDFDAEAYRREVDRPHDPTAAREAVERVKKIVRSVGRDIPDGEAA